MDAWFEQSLVVTATASTGSHIDFNDHILDFTKGYEIALLEAHIDFRPDNDESASIEFNSQIHGNFSISMPDHTLTTADDFIEEIGCAGNGLQEALAVNKVDRYHVQFSIRDTEDIVSISAMNEYTRSSFLHEDIDLDKDTPSITYDLHAMRIEPASLDIYLHGFLQNDKSSGDLLDSIPLHGDECNLHFEPKFVAYKPVTRGSFSRVPITFEFLGSEGDREATRLQQATLILHLREIKQ